jgi:hypothetical protein
MLVNLLNVPQSDKEWEIWSLSHALDHDEIRQSIVAMGGPNLPKYVMQPLTQEQPGDFLQNNSQSHTDMNAFLNLNSSDLLVVDFKDQNQKVAWINVHYQEHFNARQVLKI